MSILKYRRDIDGLRALAVAPVILYHAGIAGFGGGFVGVDIFFVISGYLITTIIFRELEKGTFSFSHFWARRARRILPAAIVVFAASIAAGWGFLAPDDFLNLGRSARAQAFFAGNFYFWQEAGYFDRQAELKPLLHTWSLAVEEQFYVFFPAIFWLIQHHFSKHKILILALLLTLSWLANILLVHQYPAATFYLLPTRAWELLTGSLLALIVLKGSAPKGMLAQGVALSGLMAIIYSIIFYNASMVFPGVAATLPVMGAAAIIWANTQEQTWVKRCLSLPLFVGIGLLSYSLYLWHWPVFVFFKQATIEPLTVPTQLGLISLSVLLAYISWRLIETPFRKKRWLSSNKKILWVGLSGILIIAMTGQLIRRAEGYPQRLTEQALKYAQASQWQQYQQDCYEIDAREIRSGNFCRLGSKNKASKKLFFWGDSHAAALLPAVKTKSTEYGVSTFYASKSACFPFNIASKETACGEFNQAVVEQIQKNKIKHILIAGRWSMYIYGDRNSKSNIGLFTETEIEEKKKRFSQNFNQALAIFEQQGLTVWLVRQAPLQNQDVVQTLTKLAMKHADTSTIGTSINKYNRDHAFVNQLLNAATEKDFVHIIDLPAALCKNTFCPAEKNGTSFYMDGDHLSADGALILSPILNPVFKRLIKNN